MRSNIQDLSSFRITRQAATAAVILGVMAAVSVAGVRHGQPPLQVGDVRQHPEPLGFHCAT